MSRRRLVKLIYYNGEDTFYEFVDWHAAQIFMDFKFNSKYSQMGTYILHWFILDEDGNKCEFNYRWTYEDFKTIFPSKPIQFYIAAFKYGDLKCRKCHKNLWEDYYKIPGKEEYFCSIKECPLDLIWIPHRKTEQKHNEHKETNKHVLKPLELPIHIPTKRLFNEFSLPTQIPSTYDFRYTTELLQEFKLSEATKKVVENAAKILKSQKLTPARSTLVSSTSKQSGSSDLDKTFNSTKLNKFNAQFLE